MFKKWILNLEFVQSALRTSFNKGFEEARLDQQRIRDFELELRMKNFLHPGGEVLVVSNEWESGNLLHGKVVGFDAKFTDLPMVKDYRTGEVFFCSGLVVPYHPELHAALKKLNPFERYSMLTARGVNSAESYIFDKNKIEPDCAY